MVGTALSASRLIIGRSCVPLQSSSKKPSYQCFVDNKANDLYKRDHNIGIFIKERGTDLKDNPIQRMIEEEGWEELVKPPKAANTSMVREFYDNFLACGP